MPAGVDVERDGPIAIVSMRDEKRRNAMSDPVRIGLMGAFTELMAESDDCRAIVLTGAGGIFCSGGAIDTMQDMTAFQGRRRMARGHELARLMVRGEKPIVAAVERFAFGAGLSIALLCDEVVAARDARFCASFGRIGLMPDMGLVWTLPQRVSIGKARRMMMLAEEVDAEEALRIGLVDRLAAPGGALAAAVERARAYAAAAPLPQALVKAGMAVFPQGLESTLDHEADGQGLLFGSADAKEGFTAFLEKRKPAFQGR